MGCIYRYVSPSGKSYIGQTCKTLDERAGYKGQHYKECPAFWRAIEKYGWDNFSREILEDGLEGEELDKKEQYYIHKFNSIVPNGYNIKDGIANQFRKKIKQYDSLGNLVRQWDCAVDAADVLKINYHNIIDCCNKRIKTAGGFIWSNKDDDDLSWNLINNNRGAKKVVQFSLNGDLIKIWDSIAEAKRETKSNGIYDAVKKRAKTSNGFKWMYYDEYLEIKKKRVPRAIPTFGSLIQVGNITIDSRSSNEKRMKPVVQYTKDGEEIARFPSIAEAQRATKILHIYECVNNKRRTAGGYIWRVLEGE